MNEMSLLEFQAGRRHAGDLNSLFPDLFGGLPRRSGYIYDGDLIILDCLELWGGVVPRYQLCLYSFVSTTPTLVDLERDLHRYRVSEHFRPRQNQFFREHLQVFA